MTEIKMMRLDKELPMPRRAHSTDAGIDLLATEDTTLFTGTTELVGTGIAVEVPAGHVGLLFIRSSIAAQRGVGLANAVGVIDADYRGEVKLALLSHSRLPQYIERGERIGQLVIVPCLTGEVIEVVSLNDTERGAAGFGSTGSA